MHGVFGVPVLIEQLRYVRLGVDNLGQAADFAQRVLGLEPIDRSEELATFRSDYRDHTLAFVQGPQALQCVGLEVRYPTHLNEAAEKLSKLGVTAQRGIGRRMRVAQGQGHAVVRRLFRQPHRTGGAAAQFRLALFPEPRRRHQGPCRCHAALARRRKGSCRSGPRSAPPVADWAGDAAYLRFDNAHHRIVLYPADKPGILAVEYAVEDVNLLMRNFYVLQNLQVPVLHGPGRRPASEQLF